MNSLKMNDVVDFVQSHIGSFHDRRLQSLQRLRLHDVLKRKNPYLFRAKHILMAQDLVRSLLDAYLSSQEETLFGEFLEQLAIFVCSQVYGGRKSSAEGVDLEFEKDDVYYLVSIKSGPNWGNSSQVKRMVENFKKAQRTLRTSRGQNLNIRAVNGCCYGQERQTDKGDYVKLCGQDFWEFISGDSQLYVEIIEPLGHEAKRRNEAFLEEYSRIVNQFTQDSGLINTHTLAIQFNPRSGKAAAAR